jgi:hypothetical protein
MSKGGRHRGVDKSPEDEAREHQAKGHNHLTGGADDDWEQDRSRGIQHGYGKNQADELMAQKTKWQNKSNGGHHG